MKDGWWRRWALAALVGLAGGASAAAQTMTNDMDLVYGRYQMAIRAAQLCRGVADDAAHWHQWSSYLDAKTNHELGAGERLFVLEGAKSDVTRMVRRRGCDSDGIKDLLALYDTDLAKLVTP
jgi:hypothetical protein